MVKDSCYARSAQYQLCHASCHDAHLAYNELSFGIHSSDEATCVELAQCVFPILDRMLIELAVEQKRRVSKQPFDSSVKELRKERTKREQDA